MPQLYKFFVVNAFADKPFGGNPAGVFPKADGLTDEQMQAIAKQLNLVETVFVLKSNAPDVDFQLRYFTPHKELPIAGHPTVATWSALAIENFIDTSKRQVYKQQTKKGIQQIRVEQSSSGAVVWMEQPDACFLGNPDLEETAEVFGLQVDDILPDFPIEAVDTGLGHIVFGVRSLEALMGVRRNIQPLKSLCSRFGVSEAQIFCKETYDSSLDFHTRNICPREGIEDPACGVGNSAMVAYMLKNNFLTEPTVEVAIEQGYIENMPSIIRVRATCGSDRTKITSMIGGAGVLMVRGEFLV